MNGASFFGADGRSGGKLGFAGRARADRAGQPQAGQMSAAVSGTTLRTRHLGWEHSSPFIFVVMSS